MKISILTLILISTFCLATALGGLVTAQESAATVKGEADKPSFQLYPKRLELVPGESYKINMATSTPSIYDVNTLTATIGYPIGWYWDTSTEKFTYVIEGNISIGDNPLIVALDRTPLRAGNSVTDWIKFTCPVDTPPGDYMVIAVFSLGYTDLASNRTLTMFGREEVTVTVTSKAATEEEKKYQQLLGQAQAKIIEAQGRIAVAERMLSQAKAEGKVVSDAEVTINQAKANLQIAQSAEKSNPTTALVNANIALTQAQNAETLISQAKKKGLSTTHLIFIAALAIAIVGVVVVFLSWNKWKK